MDSNKDEALRCVVIAKEAISSGDKEKALRLIKIAQRLDSGLSLDELLAACCNFDSFVNNEESFAGRYCSRAGERINCGSFNGEQGYSVEHLELVNRIKREKDYYVILGVTKMSSDEEIKRAYKKLSLKVHPDKNKVPGSEEAFKKLCKAFECLSNNDSRRKYDRMCFDEGFEEKRQSRYRSRRRRNVRGFDEDIFTTFSKQADVDRRQRSYRSREMGSYREYYGGGLNFNLILLLQLLPFILIILIVYLPFVEPHFSLRENPTYHIPKTTEKFYVEFFVKSSTFDQDFPIGSDGRANIEQTVINEYRHMLWRNCRIELKRRNFEKNRPTPSCIKLQNHGFA